MKRFRISIGAVFLLASAVFFDAGALIPLAIAAAAVHELGHYAAIRLCGGGAVSLKLEAAGVVMEAAAPATYGSEVIIAAAGPVASAFLMAAAAFASRYFPFELMYKFTAINLIYCVFNLLPVAPLDGGRILYAASARALGLAAAERVTCAVSCAVICAALCAGAYTLVVTGKNFTLLLAAGWLLIYYCKKGNNKIKFNSNHR